MNFIDRQQAAARFDGKTVAIVGSGPGVLSNPLGLVDDHDVVVRVNNYKLAEPTGLRTDVFYSFFGTSIKKTVDELKRDGVSLCICKCPNAHAIKSDWHRRNGKMIGVDYRPHYQRRQNWWFCDTYIPTIAEFMVTFRALDQHMPTSGFAAIFDVLTFRPKRVYLTGFDFFQSKIHNVDERWAEKNTDDPIRHRPDLERAWLIENFDKYPIAADEILLDALSAPAAA